MYTHTRTYTCVFAGLGRFSNITNSDGTHCTSWDDSTYTGLAVTAVTENHRGPSFFAPQVETYMDTCRLLPEVMDQSVRSDRHVFCFSNPINGEHGEMN